jgi:hypothetical protein
MEDTFLAYLRATRSRGRDALCYRAYLSGQKKPKRFRLGLGSKRLAIPYFRMATCHTIIGAKRFHCRVRDGIGWVTLAMVTKQTGEVDAAVSTFGRTSVLALEICNVAVLSQASVSCTGRFLRPATQTDWVLYGQASRAISTG